MRSFWPYLVHQFTIQRTQTGHNFSINGPISFPMDVHAMLGEILRKHSETFENASAFRALVWRGRRLSLWSIFLVLPYGFTRLLCVPSTGEELS